jgi:magnesium transporter
MLLSCVVYQDGKKIAEIATREIHKYVSRPNCFVWVALRDPQAPELDEMQQEFDLQPGSQTGSRQMHEQKEAGQSQPERDGGLDQDPE